MKARTWNGWQKLRLERLDEGFGRTMDAAGRALVDRLRDAELGLERREKEKRVAIEAKSNAELVLNDSKRRLAEDVQPKRKEHEKQTQNERRRVRSDETNAQEKRRHARKEKNTFVETKKQWEYQKRALKQASDAAQLANEKLSLTKQTLREHAGTLRFAKEIVQRNTLETIGGGTKETHGE